MDLSRYRLTRYSYRPQTPDLAQALIGCYLVHDSPEGRTIGRIVETEAYLAKDDPACHAARGKTPRNEMMFGPAGQAYIYFIYGMYYCFNVVSGKVGQGEAVLVRALEPIDGIPLMAKRRGVAPSELRKLCSGPGKLVIAMGLERNHNGQSLLDSSIYLLSRKAPLGPKIVIDITTTPRVGIKQGAELLLRYCLTNSPFLSQRVKKSS